LRNIISTLLRGFRLYSMIRVIDFGYIIKFLLVFLGLMNFIYFISSNLLMKFRTYKISTRIFSFDPSNSLALNSLSHVSNNYLFVNSIMIYMVVKSTKFYYIYSYIHYNTINLISI
jgi:hypothetical protein